MCSLGHHEQTHAEPSERVKRQRKAGGSFAGPLRERPRRRSRKEIAENRQKVVADLRASLTADAGATPFDAEQFELLPPHEQNLPDRQFVSRCGGLPDPKTLYYSAAREA